MAVLDRLHAGGTTLLMATHDPELAYSWADRVIVLHEGRVASEGPPQEVLVDPGILQELGSEPPWLVGVYQWLVERRLIPAGVLPRRREELFRLP